MIDYDTYAGFAEMGQDVIYDAEDVAIKWLSRLGAGDLPRPVVVSLTRLILGVRAQAMSDLALAIGEEMAQRDPEGLLRALPEYQEAIARERARRRRGTTTGLTPSI